jgi:photosystem II stability/assembly factor-like uncharacterized protein
MTGSYISNDGGASWRMFNLRDGARFFVFDPNDSNVIYAGTDQLWHSTDAGVSWRLVHPKPDSVTGARMPGDHAEFELISRDSPAGPPSALAIEPGNSKVLYAGFPSRLYISRDSGSSWTLLAETHTPALTIALASDRVYLIGANEITSCRGMSCTHAKTPAPFIAASAAGGVFYGISKQSVFVSENAGQAWRKSDLPGLGSELRAVATSSQHGETAYISYSNLKDEGRDWFGVAKTSDTARTWQLVWKESSKQAANIDDAWVTARFGAGWGENPLSLGVAPTDSNIVYGTDLGRTLRSTDGGKSWNAVYSRRTPSGGFTTTGLDVTTAYGVHVDPFDRNRMFISYTDIGLFRSDDGGKSWNSSTTDGVPRRWVNTTYWMAFDPMVKGRAWAVMSGTHDLPRPKMWRRRGIQGYQGGVVVTDDGGKTWRVSNNGMEPTAATHILLDPKSSPGARVLYVAAFGRGVYKSIDDGKTWALKNSALPGPEPFAWRLVQDRSGELYVILARRSEDGSYGNAGDGALYRSSDGAEHWTRVSLPSGLNGPNGLAIDPADSRRLYLAAWGRKGDNGAVDGGIWLSSDSGASWKNVLNRDQHVYDITIDPARPDTLYACGFESSAWRSTDRGMTWRRIGGYNFKWGHRVIPDPYEQTKIYITTFGGSVWHGPAQGDPGAREDILSPQLAYR